MTIKLSDYARSIGAIARENVRLKRLRMATSLLKMMAQDIRDERDDGGIK